MTPLEGPVRRPYPRSVENLALALVTLEALLTPQPKAGMNPLRAPHDKCQEELDEDPLAPARGILNGLRLSVAMWGVILLVVLLMR
jgi:hypothetical protein